MRPNPTGLHRTHALVMRSCITWTSKLCDTVYEIIETANSHFYVIKMTGPSLVSDINVSPLSNEDRDQYRPNRSLCHSNLLLSPTLWRTSRSIVVGKDVSSKETDWITTTSESDGMSWYVTKIFGEKSANKIKTRREITAYTAGAQSLHKFLPSFTRPFTKIMQIMQIVT